MGRRAAGASTPACYTLAHKRIPWYTLRHDFAIPDSVCWACLLAGPSWIGHVRTRRMRHVGQAPNFRGVFTALNALLSFVAALIGIRWRRQARALRTARCRPARETWTGPSAHPDQRITSQASLLRIWERPRPSRSESIPSLSDLEACQPRAGLLHCLSRRRKHPIAVNCYWRPLGRLLCRANSILLPQGQSAQEDAHECERCNYPRGNHQSLFGKDRKGGDYCHGDATYCCRYRHARMALFVASASGRHSREGVWEFL